MSLTPEDNEDPDDRELTAAFSTLRQEEEEQCPPFSEVVRRGRVRSLPSGSSSHPRLLWAAAAGIVLAVLALWLSLRASESRIPVAGPPSLAEWRSPTDFLLETAGGEILTDPARLDQSLLDLKPTLPSQERRSSS
jgi:hypothetical protein